MPMYQFTGRRVRVYDGTTPSPFYVEIPLLDPITVDVLTPQAEEELILDGGRVTSHAGYVVTNEAPIFQFTEVPFRFGIESTARSLVNAFANPYSVSPWTVGADTWAPVLPANIGTREDSQGTDVTPPSSAIARNIASMVNVYVKVLAPPDDSGGDSLVIGLLGLACGGCQFVQEDPRIYYSLTMRHYGGIVSGLADFPTGTETTAT